MSFENEFDKIIKQKSQEHSFPFDEGNWEKAEQMIDTQRKATIVKSSSSLLKVFGIIGLLGIVSAGAYLMVSSDDKQLAQASEQKVVQNLNAKSQEEQNNNNVVATGSNQQQINKAEDSEKKSNSAPEDQIAKSSPAIITPNPQLNALTQTNSKVIAEENDNPEHSDIIEKESQTIIASNSTNVDEANNTLAQVPKTENQENTSNSSENNAPLTPAFRSDANNNLSKSSEEITNNKNDLDNSKQQFQNTSNLEIEWLAQRHLIETETDTNLIVRPLTPMSVYENSSTKSFKMKTHFLNIGAGLNYSNGWLTQSGSDGRGLNYYAGFNYGFYISKKLILGAGLNYYNIQNIKQSFYTSQKTFYSFSSNNTYTSVTTNNLNYLSIPVKLYFDINQLHVLSIGALPSILVGAKNTVQVYNLIDEQKVNVESTTNKSLYNGVAQKYMQLSLGYRAKLSNRLWIETEALYGLTDLFENNSTNNFAQNPLGLRLGLQFNIFDK